MNAFDTVWTVIRTDENYVPRNFQTVGGMWTVDTWKKDGVTIQLMDEGYTQRIFAEDLDVTQGYKFGKTVLEFKKGNEETLETLKKQFTN